MFQIRTATEADLPAIMRIYEIAQDFMIATGNPTQWARRYPTESIIRDDIRQGSCHLVCEDERVHGVFALCEGEDPAYRYLEGGAWLNDEPYIAVHRVASGRTARGIFACAIEFCKGRCDNVRIDTHHDNAIMQRQIEKHGFVRCGTVYMEDGSPRIAYHYCASQPGSLEQPRRL